MAVSRRFEQEKASIKSEKYQEIDTQRSFFTPYPSKPNSSCIPSLTIFLFHTLYSEFQNIWYFWFILILILSFYDESIDLSLKLSNLISFLFIIFYSIFQKLRKFSKNVKKESVKNSEIVKIWSPSGFTEVPVSTLKPGDLVTLTKGEEIPADLLLIWCGNEKNAFFDMKKYFGLRESLEKRPMQALYKLESLENDEISLFLSQIESLETTFPSPDMKNFKAKIRFKGDPKVNISGTNQLILAGSKLVSSDPIAGIVIFSGFQTSLKLSHKRSEKKLFSPSIQFLNTFQFFHFLVTFILIVISCIAGGQSNYPPIEIEELFIWNVLIYCNLVSLSMLVTLKLSGLLMSFQIKGKLQGIQVDPEVTSDLGQVEYLLVDKEELVQRKDMKIRTINIENECYIKEYSQERIRNQAPSPTSYSTEDGIFTFDHLVSIFQSEKLPHYYFEFIFAAALDQHAFYKENEKTSNQSNKIKKILTRLGLTSLNPDKKQLVLQLKTKTASFKIIDAHKSNKNNFLLVLSSESSEIWALSRTNSKSFLFVDDSKNLAESTNLYGQCLKTFYYLSKFSMKDLPKLSSELKLARKSLITPEKKVKKVYKSFFSNSVLLGFLSFDYSKNKQMAKSLKNIRNEGVKTWVVSSDNSLNTFLACKSCKTIDFESRLIHFTRVFNKSMARNTMLKVFKDENLLVDCQSSVKDDEKENEDFLSDNEKSLEFSRILKGKKQDLSFRKMKRNRTIKSFIEPSKIPEKTLKAFQLKHDFLCNFSLLIDSEFLDKVLLDEENRKLLVILLFLAKSVCFAGLSSNQKKEIVRLAKEDFSFNPIVSALGDFCADPAFLSEAHFSISSSQCPDCESSVKLSKSSDIDDLLIFHGERFSVVYFKIVVLSIVKSFTICFVLFFYQGFNSFSPCILIRFDALVVFEFGISVVLMIALIFSHQGKMDEKEEFRENYELPDWKFSDKKGIRPFGFSQKMEIFARFAGFAIVKALVLTIFLVLAPGYVRNRKGMTEQFEIDEVSTFLIVVLGFFIEVFLFCEKASCGFLTVFVGCFVALVIFCYFQYFLVDGMLVEVLSEPLFWIQVVFIEVLATVYFYFILKTFKNPSSSNTSRIHSYTSNIEKVVKKSRNISKKILNSNSLILGLKSLKFDSDLQELKYQEFQSVFIKNQLKFVISLVSLICLVFLVLQFSDSIDSIKYKIYSILPSLFSLVFVIWIFQKKVDLSKLVFSFGMFILCLLIIYSVINELKSVLNFVSIEVLFCIIFHLKFKMTAILVVLFYFGSSFVIIYLSIQFESDLLIDFQLLFITFFISCLLLFISYLIDLSKRQEYIFIQQSERMFKKSSQILSYLLPEFVKKRVNDGVRYIAEEKGVVSVIFCDICEFDKIIEDYSQSELVALLDDLFSRFDKICQEVGVSKIETVGKTYLACSGLKDFDSDLSPSIKEVTHARRALEMAFSVLHESKKTILKSGNRLKMKIGIHSGPVVAGVVGYHKPQFSLVGDTVNTASRMASTLETYDQVQISLETFTLLENDTEGFLFTNNYPEVKGKGKMKTFIVQAEVGENVMQAKGSSFSLASTSFEKSVKHKKIIKEDEVEVSWFSYFRNNSLTLREKLVQIFYLESQTDKEFQQFFDTHTRSLQLVGLLISFFHNLFSIIASSIQYSSSRSNSSLSTLLLYTCEEFLTILLLFYLKFQKSSKILFFTLQFILISEILIFFIKDLKKEINFQISLLLFFLRFLQLNFCTSFLFFRNLLTNLISISLLISKLSLLNDSADNYLFSFFFIICTLFSTYFREAKLRKDFRLREKFQKEHKKTEGLLNQMLPSQVVFKLQREVNVVENISTVTVIYADIVGFTQWSSTRSPPEVISMLSELFTRFDRLCLEFSVYKVYTIGDCYVAMGYEGKDRRNPVKEAVMTMNFAFELLKVIQEVNEKIDAGLNMRIGLHTGDIIGAITGTNIVRYDIYGKDVLIANKMESNGLAGMIHVSEKTKELIESTTEDLFNFSQFKQVKTWDSFITTYMVSKTIHS